MASGALRRAGKWAAGLVLVGLALIGVEVSTRVVATATGARGWFRANRPATVYRDRFAPLDLSAPCSELTSRVRDPSSPIIVLIHGVGGEGPEMHVSLATLMEKPPASVFMFRWVPYEPRDLIARRLVDGLSRIAACLPESEGRLLVLAHSAGGVVASFAVGHLKLPSPTRPEPWLTLLTVASPLAGKRNRPARPDGGEQLAFFFDLGTRLVGYPRAAPGVRVVHLRTHFPADPVMEPNHGLSPNDPSVGVPGAPQIDLPENLDHPGSLEYVAAEIAADRWKVWRDGAAAP